MAGAAKPKIKAKTTKREVLEQGIQKAGDSYGRRPWKDDACLGARRFRFAALRSNIIPAALGLANSGSLRSASPLPIGHGAALRVPLLHSSCSRCGLATSAPGVPPSPARPHPTQRAQKLPMRPCRLAGLQPQGEKNCARGLSQRGRACSRQSTLTCPPERTHSQNEKEEEKKIPSPTLRMRSQHAGRPGGRMRSVQGLVPWWERTAPSLPPPSCLRGRPPIRRPVVTQTKRERPSNHAPGSDGPSVSGRPLVWAEETGPWGTIFRGKQTVARGCHNMASRHDPEKKKEMLRPQYMAGSNFDRANHTAGSIIVWSGCLCR